MWSKKLLQFIFECDKVLLPILELSKDFAFQIVDTALDGMELKPKSHPISFCSL